MLFYVLVLITGRVGGSKFLKIDYEPDAAKIGGAWLKSFEISCLRNIDLFLFEWDYNWKICPPPQELWHYMEHLF